MCGLVQALGLTPKGDALLVGGEHGLAVYHLRRSRQGQLAGLLRTHRAVCAIAPNPVDPRLALLGTMDGQIAYVQLPPAHAVWSR